MKLEDIRCAHTCRNACGLLNEALHAETAQVRFYERVMAECDYPDVQAFVRQLMEERSASILRIVQKLNELQARSKVLDGVMSSFDPSGV
jgi:rubrerythrin